MYYHFNSRSLWWDTSPPLERSPTALKWVIALGCGASSALRASRRSRPTAAPPAMAPAARSKPLAIGDTVSVAVRQFGEAYARKVAGRSWASDRERCEGLLVDRDGEFCLVEFDDMPEPVRFKRTLLQFVARESAVAGSKDVPLAADSSEDDEQAEQPRRPRTTKASAARAAAAAPAAPRRRRQIVVEDSSNDDSSDEGSVLSADEDEDEAEDDDDGWRRDDNFATDERARHGFHAQHGAQLMMPDYMNASFFSIVMWWLSAPLALSDGERGSSSFLEEMAAQMQAKGRAKATGPSDRWAQCCISVADVTQWIGCWYYMLAYPQTGSRDDYFKIPAFGPTHNLANIMSLAENGHRGRRFFQNLHTCFTLPTGSAHDEDEFKPVRCMWESYRQHFVNCVQPGWLLLLDESMIRWLGRHMPGLMVVQRKPTPIGAELHTMCCALSGIMINFEVYEGKKLMEQKKYCDTYPKHVALSLRCCEPYFGSVCACLICSRIQHDAPLTPCVCVPQGRVLIADSWFGSIPCAKALFEHGLFAVMNVKTCHKGFPKEQLLNVVGEVKGKSDDARERRRARRGKQVAFVKKENVGGKELTLLAAGHNKKVPLLLIATHSTMLPAGEHVKRWRTPTAEGGETWHKLVTKQTAVHKLYRENMNAVDLHNKLRQGVCAMADVWKTKDWVQRHFAELLGFLEVNIYLSLKHFIPTYKEVSHSEFRKQLAWALLTLGKADYPETVEDANSSRSGGDSTINVTAAHEYVRFPNATKHLCAYCGSGAYQFCLTCHRQGLGCIAVCGRKTGRPCMQDHVRGEKVKHASWKKGKSRTPAVDPFPAAAPPPVAAVPSTSVATHSEEEVSARPLRRSRSTLSTSAADSSNQPRRQSKRLRNTSPIS